MQYREIGSTGEKVSTLGFGCMRLPVINGNVSDIDEKKATHLIRTAIDMGVNYVDTAYPYHGKSFSMPGNSEPFVGRALKDGYREKVYVTTKLLSRLVNSRQDMDRLLEDQLRRLDTGHIDFYLLHGLTRRTWKVYKENDVGKFFDDAIKSGKIRYAGFSFHADVDLFKEVVDYYDWSICQIQYNFMDTKFQAGKEGLEYAARKGLGISIMEPLRGGSLAVNTPDPVLKRYNEIVPGRSSVDWALRWVMNHPEVSVVLSGMNEIEHVLGNISTAKTALPHSMNEEELRAIEFAERYYREMIKIPCTECRYCMPCPAGVAIPDNFKIYNDYSMYNDSNEKTKYKTRLKGKAKAEFCIKCGQCEQKCPQEISIIKELENVVKTLKE